MNEIDMACFLLGVGGQIGSAPYDRNNPFAGCCRQSTL